MSGRGGYVYVLTHVAWEKIGLVKIGMTSRDPRTRAAEITSVSGLIAPCRVAWCVWVEDRAEVERVVKAALADRRVSGRRELFRTDVQTARAAVESAACRKIVTIVTRRRNNRTAWRHRRYQRPPPWGRLLLCASLIIAAVVWLR